MLDWIKDWFKKGHLLFTPQEQRQRRDIKIIGLWILSFFLIGIVVTYYFTNCWSATPIMWALACSFAGGTIGFLFGVPKVESNTTPSNQAPSTPSRGLRVNTNIEQISDWLAKIVVGVTLTQLTSLPGFIRHMAHVFASDECAGKCSENFGIAMIVYFVALGLAAGYLLTRIYLSLVFSRADGANSTAVSIVTANLSDEEYSAISSKQVFFEDDSFSEPQKNILDPALDHAAGKLSLLPLEEVHAAKALELWARAMIGKGKYAEAAQALEKAISQGGGTSEYYYEYAVALYFSDPNREDEKAAIPHSVHDALINAYKRLPTCDNIGVHRSVYIGLTFYALYVPPPGGFEEAIKYGEEYIQKYDALLPSGRIYFYLSAAYGQQAKYSIDTSGYTFDYTETRNLSLKFANAAIRRDAGTYLPLLQSIVNPSKDEPLDNDLEVFGADQEFMNALGLKVQAPTAPAANNPQEGENN